MLSEGFKPACPQWLTSTTRWGQIATSLSVYYSNKAFFVKLLTDDPTVLSKVHIKKLKSERTRRNVCEGGTHSTATRSTASQQRDEMSLFICSAVRGEFCHSLLLQTGRASTFLYILCNEKTHPVHVCMKSLSTWYHLVRILSEDQESESFHICVQRLLSDHFKRTILLY